MKEKSKNIVLLLLSAQLIALAIFLIIYAKTIPFGATAIITVIIAIGIIVAYYVNSEEQEEEK